MIFNLAFSFLFNFGLYAVSSFFVLCTTEKSLKFAIVFANVFSLKRLGDRQINLQIYFKYDFFKLQTIIW